MKINRPSDPWLVSIQEEIELAHLYWGASLSCPERIIWLENAWRLARNCGWKPARKGPTPEEWAQYDLNKDRIAKSTALQLSGTFSDVGKVKMTIPKTGAHFFETLD